MTMKELPVALTLFAALVVFAAMMPVMHVVALYREWN